MFINLIIKIMGLFNKEEVIHTSKNGFSVIKSNLSDFYFLRRPNGSNIFIKTRKKFEQLTFSNKKDAIKKCNSLKT
jgi:hypothetical protein